jgi:predicted transcriptional regulator
MAPKLMVFKTPREIRTVMHPLRMEIIERLEVEGPDSIAGLAAKLERPANALTYHVRLLERAGVLVRQGSRRAKRRPEAVYELTPARIAIGADPRSPSALRAAASSVTAICRMADREIRHALKSGLLGTGQPVGRRYQARLSEPDLKRVHRKLAEIGRILERARDRKQGRPHAFTSFLVPLVHER